MELPNVPPSISLTFIQCWLVHLAHPCSLPLGTLSLYPVQAQDRGGVQELHVEE